MDKLYLTLGSKNYLLKLADQIDDRDVQLVSKPGQSQFGIISKKKLAKSINPIEFDLESQINGPDSHAQLVAFYYFVGEDKQADIAKKTLLFNQNSLTESGISGAAWLREHKDLRRYVFKAEFEDAASYQHFNHSKIMASLTANFYSSFNVIYAKGFDED
ncbi:hypothetical protein DLJ48_00170 [Oenococcus sicerae]|uniref:ABM domain-containing protein n=1 Tax=Oenococcus sicerae TaxID=2203724 RepID=A0AAJ1RAC8_9LACO|nr:hypothetical protein [Oenococcus sicerae]MDN6899908.1 hypothetical protein [Oenococcus sicerae]QAS69059.1 hypothetical protein DLJ48_00170 [Oenococcus sicerae]